MSFEIRCVESMPYAENSYILWRPGRSDALVVDPGFEPELIFQTLNAAKISPAVFLNTHGHVDHIAGNKAMKKQYPHIPLIIGQGDAPMLTDPFLNLSAFADEPVISPPADQTVAEGQTIEFAGIALEVLEIPGHSPGHVVYVLREGDQVTVLGGDVLFQGSIGRTDFPGGSLPMLLSGIRKKLWPLPDNTIVYPGHGPATTVGEEKKTNPFCAGF